MDPTTFAQLQSCSTLGAATTRTRARARAHACTRTASCSNVPLLERWLLSVHCKRPLVRESCLPTAVLFVSSCLLHWTLEYACAHCPLPLWYGTVLGSGDLSKQRRLCLSQRHSDVHLTPSMPCQKDLRCWRLCESLLVCKGLAVGIAPDSGKPGAA